MDPTRTVGSQVPSRLLRWNLLVTDIGFLLYWLASGLGLFPPDWLYKDHDNPILMSWNWSFAPVDLVASSTGLYALWLARSRRGGWSHWALISLSLTFCAGLMAVGFWFLRRDFALAWWLPNVYLIVWPTWVFRSLLPAADGRRS